MGARRVYETSFQRQESKIFAFLESYAILNVFSQETSLSVKGKNKTSQNKRPSPMGLLFAQNYRHRRFILRLFSSRISILRHHILSQNSRKNFMSEKVRDIKPPLPTEWERREYMRALSKSKNPKYLHFLHHLL